MKNITFPFKDKKKIDQTIAFEIENYIPFNLSEIVFDYQIVSQDEENSQIIACILKKEYFDNFLKFFEDTIFEPKSIICDSLALSNLFNLNSTNSTGCFAILDLGHSKTNICIISDKKPLFARTVLSAGNFITENIKTAMNVSYEEAEKLKIAKSFIDIEALESSQKKQPELSKVIKDSCDVIINEIMQTIKAFESKHDFRPQEIFLCGGTYKLKNFPQYLSMITGIKCSPVKYLEGSYNKLESVQGKAAIIPQSFALALSGVSSVQVSKINFRRGEYALQKDIKGIKKSIVKYAIMTGIIIILGLTNVLTNYFYQKNQEEALLDQVHSILSKTFVEFKNKEFSPKKSLSIMKDRIKKETAIKDALNLKGLTALDILNEISKRSPKDVVVDVTELNITNNKVRMSGTIDSIESVDKIITALQEFEHFIDIEKGAVKASLGDKKRFSISFRVEEEK